MSDEKEEKKPKNPLQNKAVVATSISLMSLAILFFTFQEKVESFLAGKFATKDFVTSAIQENNKSNEQKLDEIKRTIRMGNCDMLDKIIAITYSVEYNRVSNSILDLKDRIESGESNKSDRSLLRRYEAYKEEFPAKWQVIAGQSGKCK